MTARSEFTGLKLPQIFQKPARAISERTDLPSSLNEWKTLRNVIKIRYSAILIEPVADKFFHTCTTYFTATDRDQCNFDELRAYRMIQADGKMIAIFIRGDGNVTIDVRHVLSVFVVRKIEFIQVISNSNRVI